MKKYGLVLEQEAKDNRFVVCIEGKVINAYFSRDYANQNIGESRYFLTIYENKEKFGREEPLVELCADYLNFAGCKKLQKIISESENPVEKLRQISGGYRTFMFGGKK